MGLGVCLSLHAWALGVLLQWRLLRKSVLAGHVWYLASASSRKRLNSESWPRAGNPGRDLRKTDCTGTSIQRHSSCANPLILENELKLKLSLISCRSGIFRRRELRSINNQIMPQILDTTCTQQNHQKKGESQECPEGREARIFSSYSHWNAVHKVNGGSGGASS